MADKVIVVAGPTASGKTALGIELALQYNGEIVSADSMQVYRGMDIGTAKATAEERSTVPHHMLDVADPREDYSVAMYVSQAEACCRDIISRGKLPVIVGGTGLYIDSLISGRDFAAVDSDQKLRDRLGAEYDEFGGEEMHRRLASIDPERAAKLPPSDKRRIVRALEIYELTGMTMTEHDEYTRSLPPRFQAAAVHLGFRDRARLYERIGRRVDMMVELGLFAEAESLLEHGLSQNCTAMQAIGYKEAAEAILGKMSRLEAVELIKLRSRRYAKRQLTWFSRDASALRIDWDYEPDFEYARSLSTKFFHSHGIS